MNLGIPELIERIEDWWGTKFAQIVVGFALLLFFVGGIKILWITLTPIIIFVYDWLSGVPIDWKRIISTLGGSFLGAGLAALLALFASRKIATLRSEIDKYRDELEEAVKNAEDELRDLRRQLDVAQRQKPQI